MENNKQFIISRELYKKIKGMNREACEKKLELTDGLMKEINIDVNNRVYGTYLAVATLALDNIAEYSSQDLYNVTGYF